MDVRGERILLIVGAGIAAYKALELVRRGRDRGLSFRCVMTAGAKEFVTPLSLATLSGDKVYTDLFSLTDEAEIGHIRLARDASLVVVAPATANLLARMANGHADDLATTVLLATDKPVLVAPAMNPFMWGHPATKRNVERLRADGVHFVGPSPGDMACGEEGSGRLAEPHEILDAIERLLRPAVLPLAGLKALVTSGPTYEPLDPVRFLGNRSSGRQGHAIAAALAEAGAAVTLVSGPVAVPDPPGVDGQPRRHGPRDAGRGRIRPAGRRRRVRRRRGRLAPGRRIRRQAEEGGQPFSADNRTRREPGRSVCGGAPCHWPAGARDRIRGGDWKLGGACRGEARA